MSNSSFSKKDLTIKQFLTIAVIEKGFDEEPTLGEVAKAISTSHQNVRQIVKILEKRKFVKVKHDKTDRRKLRLSTTAASKRYFAEREEKHNGFIANLFSGLTNEEAIQFHDLLWKLLATTDDVYQEIRGND